MSSPGNLYNDYVLPAATGVKNTVANLFSPQDIASLPYDAQAAALARRQKLAEMLMQQGQQQPEVLTYKGIAAQPSVAGGLGKALSQFMGAYMGGKAEEDAAKLEKTGNENFIKSVGNYYVDPGTPETKIPETNVNLDMPTIPKAVFDKNTGSLALGADAGTTPTNFNIPAIGLGDGTPSHTRTLDERMAYDLSNMSGGNKAQSTHFATQYAADAAKSQAMNQLKPQVDAVLGRTGVPDNIRSDLKAQMDSEDPEALRATLKEYQSKSTAQVKTATLSEFEKMALDHYGPNYAQNPEYQAFISDRLAGRKSAGALADEFNLHNREFKSDFDFKLASNMPDDATLDRIASSYLAGNKGEATGYGRNPAAQRAIAERITAQAAAKGLSGPDINRLQQDYAAGTKAINAYDSGAQSKQTQSLNTVAQHLELGRQLILALKNNDIPAANSVANAIKTATGSNVATNLSGASGYLANEMQKATGVGAGGTDERKHIADQFSAGNSINSLLGTIDTAGGFIAGQAGSLEKSYQAATGRDDYRDKYLLPATVSLLNSHATTPQAAIRPPGVPSDWVLHADAKGNQAYVSPNGKQFQAVPVQGNPR
jgi:hypothetical protein